MSVSHLNTRATGTLGYRTPSSPRALLEFNAPPNNLQYARPTSWHCPIESANIARGTKGLSPKHTMVITTLHAPVFFCHLFPPS